jgi:hypothetical protein
MDDLEQRLKRMSLTAPSARLDQRIAEAVAAARRRQQTPRLAPSWWWTMPLAMAAGMAALFVVSERRSFPPEVTVYRIEAQGHMREMLLNPATTREAAAQFVFSVNSP